MALDDPWAGFIEVKPAAPPTAAATAAPATPQADPWAGFKDITAEMKPIQGKDAGIYSRFLAGFTSDEQEKVRMLADQLFPGEALDKSVQRFGRFKGQIVYRGDDGQMYEAMPTSGLRGMAGDIVQAPVQHAPAIAGATAGMATAPLATTGVGLLGTMAAAGGAAVGTEIARQKLGDILLGRASTDKLNVPEMIKQGGESAFGQGIGAGMTALATRGAVRDISKFDPVKTQQAYDEAARTGVPITPAEATGLPTLAAQQKRLTNITATSDEMRTFLDERNKKVLEVWGGFLNRISGAADAEDVGKLARETAGNVLKDMRTKLQQEATPFYRRAYEEGGEGIWSPTLERLTGSTSVVDAMRKAVSTWRDNAIADGFGAMNPGVKITEDGRIIFPTKSMHGPAQPTSIPAYPDLQFWDYTKRALDGMVEAAISAGERGRARVLKKIVGQLRSELDAIGPDSYKKARQIWGTGSDDIATAMDSALNILATTKDTSILQAARHIFDPSTRSPQMVGKLKVALEDANPDAWQGLKRLYMQDVTADALRITETGDILNPAGKLFKAFSNPKVAANLRVAMNDDERATFKELMSVFRRAASVPALRSDTEFNRLMTEEAERAAQPVLAKVVGGVKALNPANENFLGLKSLQEFLTNRNLDKQAERVVEIVTSGDPGAIDAMKELRKISVGTKQGLVLLGHLLGRTSAAAAEQAITKPDDAPSTKSQ